jgi:hypothetical protein
METVLHDIEDRALSMPWMTAVRLHGRAVSYGELAAELEHLQDSTASYAAAPTTLLFAALMRLLPRDVSGSPVDDSRVVGAAIGWLGRHVESVANEQVLRAV